MEATLNDEKHPLSSPHMRINPDSAYLSMFFIAKVLHLLFPLYLTMKNIVSAHHTCESTLIPLI
jgi:hypothetical protein